jgi:ferrous iron transport protein B
MNKHLIALAGNPNAGKSTIFNALTGSNQHVGNWPGKTVAKKEGTFKQGEYEITVVDLPGSYSLTAYSPEEIITRDFIINERPSLVVTVVDAANLERNLYLTIQVLELGVPVVIALNMSDVAKERGITIDSEALSQELGSPVVGTVASQGEGIEDLKEAIAARPLYSWAESSRAESSRPVYSRAVSHACPPALSRAGSENYRSKSELITIENVQSPKGEKGDCCASG